MTRAQLRHFRAPLACGLASPEALAMVGLTSLTMGLVRLVPRLTRAVPPTLAAVSLVSVLSSVLKLPATTLADLAGKEAFAGGLKVLPSFKVPAAFSALKTAPAAFLKVVLPYAATMACVGLVEGCVEINQCFLGDDAAALAPSSGEEPAPLRHRAGVASMAWRSTRRFSTNAP